MNPLVAIGWVGTFVSLAGALCIARNWSRLWGFGLFLVSGAMLIGIQIQQHIWNQVAVLAAYMVIDVIGIHATLSRKAEG